MRAILDLPLISRVRQNHALEHATMHVLGARHPELRLVGHSSLRGFDLYGNLTTESVLAAAQEGLRRLRSGQRRMAVHPNCGSNLAAAGILSGLGAFLVLGGKSKSWLQRLSRLPMACVAALVGIVLARPIGALLQARITTEADVGNLRIVGVARTTRAGIPVHHLRTGL